VENQAPYGIITYYLDQESLDAGRKLVSDAMLVYKENSGLDEWAGYPDDIKTLSIF
jgi:hypothetical protein